MDGDSTFPASQILKTMAEETSKPPKGLVSDDLFSVSPKSAHFVAGFRVFFSDCCPRHQPNWHRAVVLEHRPRGQDTSPTRNLSMLASRKGTTMTAGLPKGCLWRSHVRVDLPERGTGVKNASQTP